MKENWLKMFGLTTEYSPNILHNVVLLLAREVETTGSGQGFFGSIVFALSTGVFSLPFTSSLYKATQAYVIFLGKDLSVQQQRGFYCTTLFFEHF